jgi:translation initiation factor 5A
MLKGFPCKVIEYSTAKPGKHGSAKATIVGTDIFTNKKYEDSMPTAATAQVPTVLKVEYEVADIDGDDFVSLIQEDGSLKSDLKLPVADADLYAELKKLWDDNHENGQVFFSVIRAVGQEKLISGRVK